MTEELAIWLATKLDIFALRVRAGRRKHADIYYCAGWADGYKAAQADARKASRGPRLPAAVSFEPSEDAEPPMNETL
jgi:hypothetical protein